jgi:DNA-binding NarL/FixJ family response regulator
MSKIRVALIEDHDLTRLGIRQALVRQPEVEFVGEAVNATQGLRLLLSTQPDVAIVDVDLPDHSGIELVQRLKQAQASGLAPATRVLMLTLRDTQDMVEAALTAGATSYCLKQIPLSDLLNAVQATHEGKAWIDPAVAVYANMRMKDEG